MEFITSRTKKLDSPYVNRLTKGFKQIPSLRQGSAESAVPGMNFNDAIVPEYWEVLSTLKFVIRKNEYNLLNDRDIALLRSLGYSKAIDSEAIAITRILSDLGITRSGIEGFYEDSLLRCPRLLIAELLEPYYQGRAWKTDRISIMGRLAHRDIKMIPKLIRIETDVYRVFWGSGKIPKCELLAKQRFLESRKRDPVQKQIKSVKGENMVKDLGKPDLTTDLSYNSKACRLSFIPVHMPGKTIAHVAARHKTSGKLYQIGVLEVKRKGLFFTSKSQAFLYLSPSEIRDRIRQGSLAGLDLPLDILPSLIALFQDLGIYPNQYIKCLRNDSPLAHPVFWDKLGIEVSVEGDSPLKIARDTRTRGTVVKNHA